MGVSKDDPVGADAGARCSALRDAPPTAPLLRTRWAVGRCGRLSAREAASGSAPPSGRGAPRRVASPSPLDRAAAAAAAAIPGAESTFSRRCDRFSERLSRPRRAPYFPWPRPEETAKRASRRAIPWALTPVRAAAPFETRRLQRRSSGRGGRSAVAGDWRSARRRAEALGPRVEGRLAASRRAARLTGRRRLRLPQSRAQNQPFQGVVADFPGERNSMAGLS